MPSVDAGNLERPPLALLVDRDADTRQMYAEFLKQSACDIEEAEDGREALAKAMARHPDVIVTETRLPGISGFDLCELLRSDVVTKDIPVVFVTGDAYDADVRRAEHVGADLVLIKPCLPDRLAAEIRRLLDRSHEVRVRARAIHEQIGDGRATSTVTEAPTTTGRVMLSRAHQRHDTMDPPSAPPALFCPTCDQALTYVKRHVGGVSNRNPEQWDYFECAAGCGTFQYRQRTRKLRRVM